MSDLVHHIDAPLGDGEPWAIVFYDTVTKVPRDLTGYTLTLWDNATCPEFTANWGAAAGGRAMISPAWPADDAEKLKRGPDIWFRLRATSPDGLTVHESGKVIAYVR